MNQIQHIVKNFFKSITSHISNINNSLAIQWIMVPIKLGLNLKFNCDPAHTIYIWVVLGKRDNLNYLKSLT